MKATEAFFLGKILVFGAVLPTVDTFFDLILSGKLFVSGHTLWAIAVLLPVVINFFFIVIAFRQFPFPPWHHRYVSITMLVLQVDFDDKHKKWFYLLLFSKHCNLIWTIFTGLAPISLPFHGVRVPLGET